MQNPFKNIRVVLDNNRVFSGDVSIAPRLVIATVRVPIWAHIKSFHAGHRGPMAQMIVTFNCERNSIGETLDRDTAHSRP
jgi:hypothetical protein